MTEVVWTKGALDDIEQIQDFIAEQSPAAAFKLASEVIGRTNRLLADNPLGGRPGRAPGTREFVVAGTPYLVLYRIAGSVEVLAIVHGARKRP